jgi:hypothetical protein
MRRMAILIAVASVSLVGAPTGSAQLPEVPLPDAPDVPDVELPKLPGDDGGGGGGSDGGGGGSGGSGSPVPSVETPIGGGGSGSGGSGGSGGGGSGGDGSGSGGGSGSDSCPCAAPASGYPVAGDYDKCPVEDGPTGAASDDAGAGLAASRSEGSSGGGANGASGGLLGVGAFGEDTSQPPTADGAPLGEDSTATSPLGVALLALAGLGLLVGIAGGLRALRDRQRYP